MNFHQLMQVVVEETPKEFQCSRETARLVDEASVITGKGKANPEEGGSGGQQTRIAEINSLDSTSNSDESPDPKAVMVSSTESLVTAATVATTSDQSEAALVKAGPSGARAAGFDEEEIRMRAQMKAAALEQGSDDDEAVPPGGGMRPNAWVNKSA